MDSDLPIKGTCAGPLSRRLSCAGFLGLSPGASSAVGNAGTLLSPPERLDAFQPATTPPLPVPYTIRLVVVRVFECKGPLRVEELVHWHQSQACPKTSRPETTGVTSSLWLATGRGPGDRLHLMRSPLCLPLSFWCAFTALVFKKWWAFTFTGGLQRKCMPWWACTLTGGPAHILLACLLASCVSSFLASSFSTCHLSSTQRRWRRSAAEMAEAAAHPPESRPQSGSGFSPS